EYNRKIATDPEYHRRLVEAIRKSPPDLNDPRAWVEAEKQMYPKEKYLADMEIYNESSVKDFVMPSSYEHLKDEIKLRQITSLHPGLIRGLYKEDYASFEGAWVEVLKTTGRGTHL
ncbi:hypothetical protein, partial [Pseudomonas fluorescens]